MNKLKITKVVTLDARQNASELDLLNVEFTDSTTGWRYVCGVLVNTAEGKVYPLVARHYGSGKKVRGKILTQTIEAAAVGVGHGFRHASREQIPVEVRA